MGVEFLEFNLGFEAVLGFHDYIHQFVPVGAPSKDIILLRYLSEEWGLLLLKVAKDLATFFYKLSILNKKQK